MKNLALSILALLSISTVALAETVYQVNFSEKNIISSNNILQVACGPFAMYNEAYGDSWLLHAPVSSYFEIVFNRDPKQNGQAKMTLTHLASLVCNQPYSPITVTINDKIFLDHYDPSDGNWVHDSFDISSWLQEGRNVIHIALDPGAIGNYWIQDFKVVIAD